jgi:uncharacterized integral membrane protein
MRIIVWLLRAFIFFALFAFALNNQDAVVVHWFFGVDWVSPLVIVVLIAFGLGCAVGVLAMVPSWWRALREARRADTTTPTAGNTPPAARADPPAAAPSGFEGEFPPRVGL